ncbi:DNA polymerase III subunit gamma/tau [Butyricicoccus porcorum]|uniref:DNA polymerase III subunit gamma/tau n=1 Tax=Butyricicoccus porcorum TaxID=1945634 RepID=UPI002355F658|nr:DNA polymerase III subunit gamma/tau [Butyricicoccus porcorum]MDD6987863.1 DNA polymerase III subunit gamma/tau [Butyricicoccus porcorum]MDY4483908.1 DNA polymerase III subunit gamma/tau [Butyricicoccus porcorum]
MYQALYRKWRPTRFADVVGQQHITDTLRAQLESGRLSHAYLFTGTRGTGKTTCAKILARAVNCTNLQNGDPCGECPSCRGILDGSVLDVVEIDAASNNGVDNIRDIRDETRYTPASVKMRVYIIDEVHMLSQGAFNALLKTLEEPPAHVLFILATTEINKVPATILSRCQRFDFRRISPHDIAHRLTEIAEQEHIALTEGGARMIARLADGALRDALSILDRAAAGSSEPIDEEHVASGVGILAGDTAVDLMQHILTGDLTAAIGQLAESYTAGRELGAVLDQLLGLIRDMLLVKTSKSDVSTLLSPAYSLKTVQRLCEGVPASRLLAYTGILQEALTRMPHAANRRIEAELCVVRLCQLTAEDYDTLSGRVDALEEKLAHGVPVMAAAPAAQQPSDDGFPSDLDAPPPGDEDMPLWDDMDAPAQVPAKPKQPEKLECSPQWNDITLAAKKLLPMSKFAQLTFAKGVLHGKDLLVVCEDSFTYELCNETSVKQALAQAAQTVMGRDYRVKVLEESNVSALSTKANPVDDIIRRAGELDIACEIDD